MKKGHNLSKPEVIGEILRAGTGKRNERFIKSTTASQIVPNDRNSLSNGSRPRQPKLMGTLECDETFIGAWGVAAHLLLRGNQ